jgi:predicted dehydrogenase/threonine dehydrogenase-like Zn-dependent dehydrogenase
LAVKQVLAKGGVVTVESVPAPLVSPKNLLVRVAWSCVSVGTEVAGVRLSGLPLYRRALKQPQHLKKVLETMRDQGVKRTWDRVTGKLAAGTPLGYSAAGTVIGIGAGVDGFQPGDRVACAGASIANHAEVIDVPVNLAVRVPEDLSLDMASTVTLGAIALQGVRRAQPTLGETFVVVGLGILGQITLQMLKANGCRVIGVDIAPDRVNAASHSKADAALNASTEDYIARVLAITDGYGADGVVITAATESSEVISQAFQACRKKARVVLVGDVGMQLRRSDMFLKEIDLLISTSYGPGRYDPVYEEEGRDYPLPYVRWTENRNMEAYLELLAQGRVSLGSLQQERFKISEAPKAYASLQQEGPKPMLVLLEYPDSATATLRKLELRTPRLGSKKIKVAIVGAGSFAQAMHLPNLARLHAAYEIHCIVSRTGHNARAAALQWKASYATTDVEEVLSDEAVELVIIATRHNLHASLALRALSAGKHVLVEKPLALNESELEPIRSFFEARDDGPVLMTGFNRRFSPPIAMARALTINRTTPMMVNYRLNAGFIPPDHWVHGPEGGGRNIGEACHIYDLFNFLTGSAPRGVSATAVTPSGQHWRRNDNFVATIGYAEGSVCSLTYSALGERTHPKEEMEIFCDGAVISLKDYKSFYVAGRKVRRWRALHQQKGQLEELQALASYLRTGGAWPISLEDQLSATRISFQVEHAIGRSTPQ